MKDVSTNFGIWEHSYALSCDAALGTYTINSDGKQATFIVDKYVLPKYGLVMEHPSVISVKDEIFTISVSGRYTYGEKVPGSVTLNICQKKWRRYWYWHWRRSEDEKDNTKGDLCYTHTAKTDSSRKVESVVKLSQFNLRSLDYARELEVEATLEEDGTEVKLSSPKKKISLQSQLTKLSFKECKWYYQPGAPYRGKLVLESYNGKRLSGKKINLSIPNEGGSGKEMYITDANGEVSFELPTSKWNKGSVSLRVSSEEI
ncbi:hypothetical protein PRIEUP_LOCUS547, partial [Pristimantis euphronides]